MPGEGWQQEEISKNWKADGPKNPLVPGKCNLNQYMNMGLWKFDEAT